MNPSKFFLSTLIAAAAMTAPVYATDYEYSESSSSGTTLSNSVPNNAEDTITFCGASGYLPGYSNDTFSSNIILTDTASGVAAITINNGSSTFGITQTFSGSISGSGTFSLASTNQTKATTYIFTGDVTAFTGNIDASIQVAGTTNSTGGGIQFGNGAAYSTAATVTDGVISNISGTGTITAGNKLTYNYAASESYTTLSIDNSSISAGTLTFQGGASYSVSSDLTAGTLTLSAGSLTLNGDTTLSSAISNSGTITFGEGANLALTEVTASVITGLDENTTGLQTVGSTYTIATGGTVSGLTTANVTVNGIGVTSVSDDGLSASISESVYNIGADASVSYSSISAEDLDAAAYINVAGTLDLGAHSSFSMNARGTGTITVSDDSTTGGHATISLGDDFAGTAKLSGEIDVGGLNVGSAKVVFSGTENNLWSYKSETISNDVTFEGATTIHSGFGGDLTFSGDVSWSDGATFDTNGKTIRFQDGNISIGAGVTVSLSDVNDVLDYDATNTITIEGTLDLSTSRQTFKSGNKLVLVDGGLIKGTNGLSEDGVSEVGDGYGAVDFMGSGNVVTAKGTGNEISANIRFRNSDVTFAVDEGSELTLSGVFNPKATEVSSANGIVKTGLGVLTLKGNNEGKSFGTTISEGTLVAASTNALGEGDVILGNGSATTGEVTLQVACDATAGVLKLNSTSVSLDLDGTLSLTQITVGETSPDSVSIDFGTTGKITTTQELNFGGSVTAFTFTLALTDEELNDLNSGENVSREILLGGGNWGIWNFGDKGTKTISITNWDISNEDYVGVIADTSTLTAGQWGYVYTDTNSQDSVAIYIAGIPEPSAFGLLAGAGALALVVSRRKRRK